MDTQFIYNCATIAIACDIGNHRPSLFYDFLFPLLRSMDFRQQFDIRINWPKFALTLYNLGIDPQPLTNELLKRRSRFETYDGFDTLECHAMERLLKANIRYLVSDFKRAIGGEYMRLLTSVDDDVIVPMLVKINIHSKELVSFRDDEEIHSISSMPCDDTSHCL